MEKVLLGEELDGIIDSTGAAKNNLVKQIQSFAYICLHYNGDESCK